MKFQIDESTLKKLNKLQQNIEENSIPLNDIITEIIEPYCKPLDDYVSFIAECLGNGETSPTDLELEDYCINLSTRIYFAGGMCERLGIRDDIAKAVYKEMYNTQRNNLDKGTVADKDSIAELKSQEEFIISSAYTRAYKIMKNKIENAQEVLQSCKKILSRRMQEMELTRIGGSGK